MIVCICRGASERDVKNAVGAGAASLEKPERCGIGGDCRGSENARLEIGLPLGMDALPRLNKGIEECRELGENDNRHLREAILEDEEEHVDWVGSQLAVIEQVGADNDLAQQVREGDE